MLELARILFPVAPVEGFDCQRLRHCVETAHIDIDAIGVRTRRIKRFDTAGPAERMARDAGIEGVRGDRVRAPQQFEIPLRHNEVEKTRLGTDRAIALLRDDSLRRLNLKGNRAAVAASAIQQSHLLGIKSVSASF